MKRAFAALLASVLSLAALPATAGGFNFAELDFGLGMTKTIEQDNISNAHLNGRGVVDFSLGSNVGTQLDFGVADYDLGTMASLEAHGYYTPNERMKLGAFVGYGRLSPGSVISYLEYRSGESLDAHYVEGGVEGIFDLSNKVSVEGSLGLGKVDSAIGSDNYKLATLGLDYDINPTSTVFTKASLTKMDNDQLKSFWAVDVGYEHHLSDAPVTLMASVGVTGATGHFYGYDEVTTEPRVQLGATWRFGGKPSTTARDTAFDSHETFRPVLQRLEF